MLPLVFAAWTALAAPDLVDPVTARIAPPLRTATAAQVRVVVESGDAAAIAAIPGAKVEVALDREVQVTVPAARIRDLAGLPGVRAVRPPFEPIEFDVITPGLDFLLVEDWHALGITGAGVKVAVIDTGFAGYEGLLGTELPASVGFTCLRADTLCTTANHGTAVAEIVHDMAPDAEIHLIAAYFGSEWIDAAEAVAAGDFDVVSCSMGFGNFYPLDGENQFSAALDAAVGDDGPLWFQAAGNENMGTWTGIVTDTNGDGYLEMDGHEEIPIHLNGTSVLFDLRWDDPWGGAEGWADDDIDAVLIGRDGGGTEVACGSWGYTGDADQSGQSDQYPWERLQCTFPGNVATAAVKLHVMGGTGAGHRVWIQNYAELDPAWWSNERSISIPSDARDALAVGAVGWQQSDYQVVKTYSGRGPTDDGRTKPDLVGPSPGDTVTRDGFSGTSAATPHLAGLAALVVQDVTDAGGTLDRQGTIDWLLTQTTDLGQPGLDNSYGWGLPQLDETWSPPDTGDTGDTGTDTADTDTGGDSDTNADTGDLPDTKSCACDTPGPAASAVLGWVALLVARRRRR